MENFTKGRPTQNELQSLISKEKRGKRHQTGRDPVYLNRLSMALPNCLSCPASNIVVNNGTVYINCSQGQEPADTVPTGAIMQEEVKCSKKEEILSSEQS